MTTRTRPTSARAATARRRVLLDPPPAYLADVPHGVFAAPASASAYQRGVAGPLMEALDRLGVAARPSLSEVEAERARRGLRPGVTVADTPTAPLIVLPRMGETALNSRHEAMRVRGRAAVASARAHLDAEPTDVVRLMFSLLREARDDREAEAA